LSDRVFGQAQAVKLPFYDPITLARVGFQLGAIDNCNVATVVSYLPCLLQFSRDLRDTFAAHAQQPGYQFLRHHQLV